jgi:hypothetical protein
MGLPEKHRSVKMHKNYRKVKQQTEALLHHSAKE